MRLAELKSAVRLAFGENLEHATPANVREFLDNLQKQNWQAEQAQRAARGGNDRDSVLDLTPDGSAHHLKSWESEMRAFFRRALDRDPDEAAALLWLFALEMAYSGIEEINSDKLNRLFKDSAT